MTVQQVNELPGGDLDLAKMPGHWLLARMGKRVLRPGGLELTQHMLDALDIGPRDKVVELAPGLGTTARIALEKAPASYVAIERDKAASESVRSLLSGPEQRCQTGTADQTGLEPAWATVVYGEAMLTMQTAAQKQAIVREAFRVLAPGGRYGIHELALLPDDVNEETKKQVLSELSAAIHVGARPLTPSEWSTMLASEGFEVRSVKTAPMHLLEPTRLVRDEGVLGALRIVANVLRTPTARRRVIAMRRVFQKHAKALSAITLLARKPEDTTQSE